MADLIEAVMREAIKSDLGFQKWTERRASAGEHFSLGPLRCPDGVECGHQCHHTCWRSIWCRPLIVFGDEWPSHTPVPMESAQ